MCSVSGFEQADFLQIRLPWTRALPAARAPPDGRQRHTSIIVAFAGRQDCIQGGIAVFAGRRRDAAPGVRLEPEPQRFPMDRRDDFRVTSGSEKNDRSSADESGRGGGH